MDWFHSEQACSDYLERLRWPKEFICPKCGVIGAAVKTSRNRLVCQSCKHQTSVTAGTIFDKTRTPLKVWLAGAWYVTNQKHGVSALGLQSVLGLGSYQTAWTMLHRFRRAMVRPGRTSQWTCRSRRNVYRHWGQIYTYRWEKAASKDHQDPCCHCCRNDRTQGVWAYSFTENYRCIRQPGYPVC